MKASQALNFLTFLLDLPCLLCLAHADLDIPLQCTFWCICTFMSIYTKCMQVPAKVKITATGVTGVLNCWMWVLRPELRSSGRIASALIHGAICPVHYLTDLFFFCYFSRSLLLHEGKDFVVCCCCCFCFCFGFFLLTCFVHLLWFECKISSIDLHV